MAPDLRPHPTRWWRRLADGRVRCELCPRDCLLKEGQRGHCFVRAHQGGELVLTTYGRSSGFCVDPIEKKPLNHFHPGSAVLSFGTAGCNLACRYCQNWDISRSRDTDTLAATATPEQIAARAEELGCRSVAFTYNDPVIFAEYAIDTARACHARGIETVAVTAGYIHAEPRAALFAHMDAANVDLKGFTDRFYQKLCRGHLEPVLDTLRYLVHETNCWVEITTLLIPGWNDSNEEIGAEATWIREELGAHVPLHLTAFHPDYRMRDTPATPLATLRRAREVAREAGLAFVYTGNLPDPEGSTTYCPGCGRPVIERDGYRLLAYRIEAGGCAACHTPIPGRFDPTPGHWGPRRRPVRFRHPA